LKKKAASLTLIALIIILVFSVQALADTTIDIGAGLDDVSKEALANKIKDILVTIGYFAGIIAVGSLIFSGFKLATAGNENKRAEAKSQIMWTLGGVVLVGMALMIVGFVASLLS